MTEATLERKLNNDLKELESLGLYKQEQIIHSPQSPRVQLQGGQSVLNFCSNNYLGLDNHPKIIEAAKKGLDRYGFGLSSVRFICGTQEVHKELETTISQFLGTEETILYPSCFDANGGLFETLLDKDDAVISDQLNHASIIDGIRLSKAQRFRYENNNMAALEKALQEASSCKTKLIATDGVFSMDGVIANLKGVCDLADQYGAMVMVDDCHGCGFLGERGRGSPELCGVLGRVNIFTGTLGKALGGASGGYTSGSKEVIGWLRQRSRPYLFSNTLAPCIAAASLAAFELVDTEPNLRQQLQDNTTQFRSGMESLGFELIPGNHPIVPVMIKDAQLASTFAQKMLEKGVYVVSFSYPVVPKELARIRVQLSAAHSTEEIDQALHAFQVVGKELGLCS